VVTTLQAERILKVVESAKSIIPHVTTQQFITALSSAYMVKKFDIGTFGSRLVSAPSMLPRCSNVEDYLRAIEDIYNFRQHDRIPLAFMAKEAAKSRSAYNGTEASRKQA